MDDRAEIENLLEDYCWAVDTKTWDDFAGCFTEDGAFVVRGRRLVGGDAIVQYVRDSVGDYKTLRHLVHHPSIRVTNNSARVRCYFELRGTTATGRDIEALGVYQDELRKTREGWKFLVREATFDYYVRRGEPWSTGGD